MVLADNRRPPRGPRRERGSGHPLQLRSPRRGVGGRHLVNDPPGWGATRGREGHPGRGRAGMSTTAVPRIIIRSGVIPAYLDHEGISRAELATRMGIAEEAGVDSGQSEPSPLFIARLMHLTGLEFDDLFVIEGTVEK